MDPRYAFCLTQIDRLRPCKAKIGAEKDEGKTEA